MKEGDYKRAMAKREEETKFMTEWRERQQKRPNLHDGRLNTSNNEIRLQWMFRQLPIYDMRSIDRSYFTEIKVKLWIMM